MKYKFPILVSITLETIMLVLSMILFMGALTQSNITITILTALLVTWSSWAMWKDVVELFGWEA